MSRLKNKVAVVTGAGGGIGSAACELFCSEGARVIGADINADNGKALEKRLQAAGYDFQFVQCDVTSAASINALRDQVKAQHEDIQVLFNNAGIILSKPLLDMAEEDWDRIQNVNLKSAFLMMRAFVPLMKQGSVVNTASIGATLAYNTMSGYGAAKAGLVQLTRVAAVEFAPHVRVNAICPGVTDTAMPRSFIAGLDNKEELWASYGERSLAKRVGRPDEIANVALFLASDESSYMSGSAVMVDSGTTIL